MLNNLSVAGDGEFVAAEFLESHGAAGVKAIGGDSDFRAHSELETVGETGAGIPVDSCGIDSGEEFLRSRFIGCDDSVTVPASVCVDVDRKSTRLNSSHV